jgi:small subunit ribosomal protein S24e
MKLEVKNEKMNPHLKRKELQIDVDHEGQATPKKDALQQLVAKQFGHNTENTDVRTIHTEGGAARSTAKVFVWAEKKPEEKKKDKKEAKK